MPLKKQTVEDIASIEHLDQPLTVVSIKGWIFLLFSILLCIAVLTWAFIGTIKITVSGKSIMFDRAGMFAINSNAAGVIKEIKVQAGEPVKKGQVIMSLQNSSKQEEQIYAPIDGLINVIKVSPGEAVHANTFLSSMQAPAKTTTLKIYGFLSFNSSGSIQPGMEVRCDLNTVDTSDNGMLRGVVAQVMPYPVSLSDSIMKEIPSDSLKEYLIGGNVPTQLLIIDPIPDSHTYSGFAWTSKEGPRIHIESGMIGSIHVTLDKVNPISYLIPAIRKK